MNIEAIRNSLSQVQLSADQAFALCRDVALAWQDPRINAPESLDLVVRLIAAKEILTRSAPGIERLLNDIMRQAGLYPYIENDD